MSLRKWVINWQIRRLERKIEESHKAIQEWRDKDAECGKGRYTGIIVSHHQAIERWQARLKEMA